VGEIISPHHLPNRPQHEVEGQDREQDLDDQVELPLGEAGQEAAPRSVPAKPAAIMASISGSQGAKAKPEGRRPRS
jgi:hypothetical protein